VVWYNIRSIDEFGSHASTQRQGQRGPQERRLVSMETAMATSRNEDVDFNEASVYQMGVRITRFHPTADVVAQGWN
jgi:hypothetical protein